MKTTLTTIILLLLLPVAGAFEAPLGIDGIIYELDGITPVPNAVTVTIDNLDTGQQLITSPGHGAPGRYSVSLDWTKDSNVRITANNPIHSSSRDVVLSGILHHVDLLLNQTLPNLPPEIQSIPPSQATEDVPYSYTPVILEWNGDVLQHGLLLGPQGMTIDFNGKIDWVPDNDDVGTHEVSHAVSDGTHLVTQNYTLTVVNVNDPPAFVSVPGEQINEHLLYTYFVLIDDPDGDNIDLDVDGPVGMSLAGTFLSWTPTTSDIGEHTVTLTADDGSVSVQQTWTLAVVDIPNAPIITSTPTRNVQEDVEYGYDISAIDFDNDPLTITLLIAPPTATLEEDVFVWTPTNDDVGYHNITINVSDGNHSVLHVFTLEVENVNDPPELTVAQPLFFAEGKQNLHQLTAQDIDGDAVTFLLVDGPAGMVLSPNGLLDYVAPGAGTFQITVSVTDGVLATIKTLDAVIVPPEEIGSGGGGGGGTIPTDIFDEEEEEETEQEKTYELDGVVQKVVLKGISLPSNLRYREYPSRPENAPRRNSLTYKYFWIGPRIRELSSVQITFDVPVSWLEEQNIGPDDVRLYTVAKRGWREIPTFVRAENDGFVVFRANPELLGVFTVGSDSPPVPRKIKVTEIPDVSTIIGFVTSKGEPVEEKTSLILKDRTTGKKHKVKTGTGALSSVFDIALNDVVGHEFVLTSRSPWYGGEATFTAASGVQRVDLDLRRGIFPVTGRAVSGITRFAGDKPFLVLLLIISVISAGLFVRRRIRGSL